MPQCFISGSKVIPRFVEALGIDRPVRRIVLTIEMDKPVEFEIQGYMEYRLLEPVVEACAGAFGRESQLEVLERANGDLDK